MEEMMAQGIRSYGPGKFNTILDGYAYEVTLDGGADEEASGEYSGEWAGFLNLNSASKEHIRAIASEQDDQLTEEEDDLLIESVAVIFFQRSDGLVDADWFDNIAKAEKTWAKVEAQFDEENEDEEENEGEEEDEGDEEEEEPEEDDAFSDEEMAQGYVISDARGGGYNVTHEHRHFEHYRSIENAIEEIRDAMEKSNFYPNIYYVNDHGNVDLLDSEGNVIESRV